MPDKPRVLVTRKLPDAVLARLARDFDAVFNPDDTPYDAETLIERSQGCEALLICGTDKLTADVIQSLPAGIRAIATFSVGYEHVDIRAADARSIIVTNTPGVLNAATADLTMMLMLGAARRASEGEAMIREGRWEAWTPTGMLGTDLTGKTLGIFGMGGIGRAVAVRARGFELEIHYHNRNRLSPEQENGAQYHDTANSLLAVSEVLSLHAPLTPETRNFLTRDRIALLPNRAIVINTARGDLVVDEDLIAALKSGKLAAAGLDVFPGEPNIHPEYRTMQNTFLLPHMGTSTVETRDAMGFCALDNLDAIFSDQAPPNAVTIDYY
ncbi:MAG: D-glycerate dehydrogenase [Alphaproteobacteria bacterium]|nr:D-glycerate dehydrogenase [Alphaproteobacteria bacterium]|tara:strand:+ start:1350 stop:2327 length:978 start_codon:yes stop_codon:yes gene_type:complete